MLPMSNQSYMKHLVQRLSQADRMLGYFRAFLETVPFSATSPGFSHLVVRAVDASESPVVEHDLRSMPLDAARIIGLLGEHLYEDSSYEVHCQWDLWVFDENARWVLGPQLLKVFSHGEEYDNSFSQENGHIEVDLGLEHLFTGHAGLLGVHGTRIAAESPEEARFLKRWPGPKPAEIPGEDARKYPKALRLAPSYRESNSGRAFSVMVGGRRKL